MNIELLDRIDVGSNVKINIYKNSINKLNDAVYFIAKENNEKFLYILSDNPDKYFSKFEGIVFDQQVPDSNIKIKRCPLIHKNLIKLQDLFEYLRPAPIGLTNSFGFGDRLGLANPGHARSLKGYKFKPIFAQQSIRELTRTERTAEDVMDSAVWAVFQEGFKNGFGADADHLKTKEDIDRMVKAGYRTFTLDPSDFINNEVGNLNDTELMKVVINLPWNDFEDTSANLIRKYDNNKIKLSAEYYITPKLNEILEACSKYIPALIHIKNLHDYMINEYPQYNHEIEVSIDETETVTTSFEHFFIVNELIRLKVNFVSLAPRFIGDFEKGIDFKGDIELFKQEYLKHLAISEYFGFYKLSFHSGSDKFTIYKSVASIKRGYIHIKTAGTSYLEALKVVAIKEPELFREILDFSVSLYETEKKSYHVSADMKKIKSSKNYSDTELEELFSSNDVRQALHVTYGRVLTERNEKSHYIFRDRIYNCLNKNEELHYELLIKHFHRHMDPFNNLILYNLETDSI